MKTFNKFTDIIEYSEQNPTELTEYKCFYNSGTIYKQCFFLNGKRHRECIWFDSGGIQREYSFYLNGSLHGEYKRFNYEGALHLHCFYRNGLKNGEYKTFNYNGSIEEHSFYINDIHQPHLDYLKTDRDEVTLTLLFGENYENIQHNCPSTKIL